MGKTRLYAKISNGQILAVKDGKRTFITEADTTADGHADNHGAALSDTLLNRTAHAQNNRMPIFAMKALARKLDCS